MEEPGDLISILTKQPQAANYRHQKCLEGAQEGVFVVYSLIYLCGDCAQGQDSCEGSNALMGRERETMERG